MSTKLDSKIPEGPVEQKWEKYKSSVALVNPANKRSLEIIINILNKRKVVYEINQINLKKYFF